MYNQSEQVAILKSLEYSKYKHGWKEGNNIHRQPDGSIINHLKDFSIQSHLIT